LAGNHLHHVSARATDHIRIVLYNTHNLSLINSRLVFLRQELLTLKISNLLLTPWATHWLTGWHSLNDFFPETIHMNLVEAIRRLEHVKILVQLIVLANELVTEHAETLLPQLLHLLVYGRRPLLFMLTQEGIHVLSLDLAATTQTIQLPIRLIVWKHDLSERFLSDLHGIILVFFEFIEGIVFLGPVLYLLHRSCRRWWYVHGEDGSKVVELSFLSLACLDTHRTHQRIETLCERSEALLLHIDALEGMVVNLFLTREHFPAGANERRLFAASSSHLIILTDVHRLLHASVWEYLVVEASISIAIAEVRVAAKWIELLLLPTWSVPVPVRKNRVWWALLIGWKEKDSQEKARCITLEWSEERVNGSTKPLMGQISLDH
jgi:hypothetical protein